LSTGATRAVYPHHHDIASMAAAKGGRRLAPDDSPCLRLPKEAWSDPQLSAACPKCGEKMNLNPFAIDAKQI
jgi:hypothetical protein